MRTGLIFFVFVTILLSSCREAASNKENRETAGGLPSVQVNTDDYRNESILQLDTSISKTDSIVFVFYLDPFGKDSLRYTRYYRQVSVSDTQQVRDFTAFLGEATERFEKVKPCRSEGKAWCFAKGDIVQTIYFSRKPSGCSHMYIIRHGLFFYSPMNDRLAAWLGQWQERAVEPVQKS